MLHPRNFIGGQWTESFSEAALDMTRSPTAHPRMSIAPSGPREAFDNGARGRTHRYGPWSERSWTRKLHDISKTKALVFDHR
jgi:hypothetical protein